MSLQTFCNVQKGNLQETFPVTLNKFQVNFGLNRVTFRQRDDVAGLQSK